MCACALNIAHGKQGTLCVIVATECKGQARHIVCQCVVTQCKWQAEHIVCQCVVTQCKWQAKHTVCQSGHTMHMASKAHCVSAWPHNPHGKQSTTCVKTSCSMDLAHLRPISLLKFHEYIRGGAPLTLDWIITWSKVMMVGTTVSETIPPGYWFGKLNTSRPLL